jgi:hyperosmotically inducible protein
MPFKKFAGTLAFLGLFAGLLAPGAQAASTDDRIESSAKESHVFKTYLKDDSIQVDSQDGFVTLSGTVAEEHHRTLAEQTVSNLPDVKRVDNQIAVKGERAAENSDAWVATKVKTALLFHKNVRASGTKVNVTNGAVTLTGEADTEAQKELTTEYARDVEGVKSVDNRMTVAKEPKKESTLARDIDDASITAQAKMTLMSHRSTSALTTSVRTDNGIVTVGGRAKNAAEKDLVTRLISDIEGVKDVRNQMSVDNSPVN